MEIAQKRGLAKTRYVFNDERVEYAWQDSSTSRSFSVPYTEISRDRQTLTERNAWYRNLGVIWLLIGALLIVVSWSSADRSSVWSGVFWMLLGAASYGYFRFNVTRYVIIPSDKGNLLIIDDEKGERIVGEIESRRKAQFQAEYDFFPDGDSPEQLRKRFNWLHSEGALTDEEFKERVNRIESTAGQMPEEQQAPVGRLLH